VEAEGDWNGSLRIVGTVAAGVGRTVGAVASDVGQAIGELAKTAWQKSKEFNSSMLGMMNQDR
jgi:hypothetical protein